MQGVVREVQHLGEIVGEVQHYVEEGEKRILPKEFMIS
jgi:hypothetical protein